MMVMVIMMMIKNKEFKERVDISMVFKPAVLDEILQPQLNLVTELLDKATVKANMEKTPNYLLKLIPHVDGTPRICELVRYYLTDVEVKAAYTGPATLQLFDHVMAPVSKLPVLEIVKTSHIIANLTLALGEVAVDYIADAQARLDSNFQ